MSSWKKIAGLFVILASAGVFAPACAMDATDATETEESAETGESHTTLNNRDLADREPDARE